MRWITLKVGVLTTCNIHVQVNKYIPSITCCQSEYIPVWIASKVAMSIRPDFESITSFISLKFPSTRGPWKIKSIAVTILKREGFLVETFMHWSKHLTSHVVSRRCKFSLPLGQIHSALSHQGELKYTSQNWDFSWQFCFLTWQAVGRYRILFSKMDCLVAASVLCLCTFQIAFSYRVHEFLYSIVVGIVFNELPGFRAKEYHITGQQIILCYSKPFERFTAINSY